MKVELSELASSFKKEFAVYRLLLKQSDTPLPAKIFLGIAVGYAVMPFDLIPDFIPVIGHLDDLVIVPSLLYLAFKFIPADLVARCRREVDVVADKAGECSGRL